MCLWREIRLAHWTEEDSGVQNRRSVDRFICFSVVSKDLASFWRIQRGVDPSVSKLVYGGSQVSNGQGNFAGVPAASRQMRF
ncbi:hypothetical protein NEOLEDRAFT_1132813 [Neolentinus lepideus HHB14362 ss-1]|uniref:Uncharacterized protein n=1 Tax=Neolentinus lepideus HHB14362 ss-1 TaxID=1314782 RepID=A0A165SY70_9AGAM|nr:hypothetical protein NEOLEDRAFT_1132813 [Neolentinus lepideus HHB14362 ss-1]